MRLVIQLTFSFKYVHPSWNEFVNNPDVKNELKSIYTFVKHDRFYPREEDVLRAFAVNLHKIQCVIIAQDPYPKPSSSGSCIATGRSIEPAKETYGLDGWQSTHIPATAKGMLKAIYANKTKNINASIRDIRNDIETRTFAIAQPDMLWDSLERQGAMMLNMALTVKHESPESHLDQWQTFLNMVVNHISRIRPNTEWLLFGKKTAALFKNLPCFGASGSAQTSSIPCAQIHVFAHPRLQAFVREDPFRYAPMINWTGL